MKYLKIKNQGEISIEAIELLGASTKRTDNEKIGMFGSGNKYALAYLLRQGYNVRIFAGAKEIKIGTIKKSLGEMEFDVITLDGKETSITTELGKDWELWQALRELYSNAKDEGGAEVELINECNPVKNETHFYISVNPEIMDWLGNFDSYFAENKEVLFENRYGRILKKHNKQANIYRKGIKIYNSELSSLYDYDFNDIEITEDRIVKYSWQIAERIWQLLLSCDVPEINENVILNSTKEGLIENQIDYFSTIYASEISESYKETLRKKAVVVAKEMTGYLSEEEIPKATVLPTKVFKALKHVIKADNLPENLKYDKSGSLYREIEINALQQATLDKAIDFLEETKYTGALQYDIKVAVFDDKKVFGTINREEKALIISEVALSHGVNTVVETLIEEYVHLHFDVKDKTRKMQDVLIRELVNLLKNKNAYLI